MSSGPNPTFPARGNMPLSNQQWIEKMVFASHCQLLVHRCVERFPFICPPRMCLLPFPKKKKLPRLLDDKGISWYSLSIITYARWPMEDWGMMGSWCAGNKATRKNCRHGVLRTAAEMED